MLFLGSLLIQKIRERYASITLRVYAAFATFSRICSNVVKIYRRQALRSY